MRRHSSTRDERVAALTHQPVNLHRFVCSFPRHSSRLVSSVLLDLLCCDLVVGVLFVHVLVFVQAAFGKCFEDFCTSSGVKKNDFQHSCWDYAHGRHSETTLTARLYHGEDIIVAPPSADLAGSASSSRPGDQQAASSSHQPAAPGASSRAASSDSAAAADEGTEASALNEEILEQHVARWNEEEFCRTKLDGLTWATMIPLKADTMEQMTQVRSVLDEYLDRFEHGTTHQWDCSKFPLNPRIWIAETIWTLEALNKQGHLPMAMTQPGDKHIRQDAAVAADGFDDPGNLTLDVVVNVLRLWKYTSGFKVEQVKRIAPGEYGTRGNKSSKGPVNLRGNIIEAATIQLQKMAKRPDEKKTHWATASTTGASGLPLGRHM
jgi:hypothetical protein